MRNVLEEVLKRTGPCLSGELLRILISEHQISPSAARQRLARRPGNISCVPNLTFPKNQQFLYLKNEYGAPHFWPALAKALEGSSPAYAGAIGALTVRGGIMPLRHFLAASGAPLNLRRHMAPETIVQQLEGAGFLEEIDVDGIGKCVAFAKRDPRYFETPIAKMRTRLLIEDMMLHAVKGWARNLALGSYNRFLLRGEPDLPQVGSFVWDLAAPSYLSAVVGGPSASGKPKPGFIVCDILLGHKQTDAGIQPFIRKCGTIRSLKNVGRCLTIFLAEDYSPSAFQAARARGIIPATPETLFGKEVASAFSELARVLTQVATSVNVTPEKLDWFFRQLGKIEGAAQSLRGALFEFIVADLVRKLWGADVTLNQKFRELGRDAAEVDVVATLRGRRIHFIECKGQEPHQIVDDAEVEKWLTRRIPIVRQKALEHPDWRGLELHFELWTSGRLSENARQRIAQAQATVSARKYTVLYRTGEEIGKMANELNDDALKTALKTHFLEHPFAADELQVTAFNGSPVVLPDFAAEPGDSENLSPRRLPKME